MGRLDNINGYYWEVLRKRKNEHKRSDLPKRICTKSFKTKIKALRFCAINKHKWIQASLYHIKNAILDKHIAGIDTNGNYKTKYL